MALYGLRKVKAEHYVFLHFKHQMIFSCNIGESVSHFQSDTKHAGYNVRNQVLVLMGHNAVFITELKKNGKTAYGLKSLIF